MNVKIPVCPHCEGYLTYFTDTGMTFIKCLICSRILTPAQVQQILDDLRGQDDDRLAA